MRAVSAASLALREGLLVETRRAGRTNQRPERRHQSPERQRAGFHANGVNRDLRPPRGADATVQALLTEQRHTMCGALAGTLFFLLCVSSLGCSGHADLQFTALSFRSIDPPPPHTRSRIDHCYWWLDEQDRVRIAMERRVASILGEDFAFQFQLSLVLEKLPAGRARNYTVGKNELRALARAGPFESRFSSTAGIVALYRRSGDRLHGSLRLQVARQSVNPLLGNLTRPTRYLITGTLDAIHDERRGRAIIDTMDRSGFAEPTEPPTESAPDRQSNSTGAPAPSSVADPSDRG